MSFLIHMKEPLEKGFIRDNLRRIAELDMWGFKSFEAWIKIQRAVITVTKYDYIDVGLPKNLVFHPGVAPYVLCHIECRVPYGLFWRLVLGDLSLVTSYIVKTSFVFGHYTCYCPVWNQKWKMIYSFNPDPLIFSFTA